MKFSYRKRQAYPGARYGYCWIEAEYKAFGAGRYAGTERWVWADVRPGGVYFEHDLNVLAPNDYGHFAGLYIVQETSPTTTWHIEIIGNSTSYYDEYSTNNRMYPDSIRIGLELSGTGGWSAPVAHFRANGWFNGARNINWQGNAGRKDSQTYPAYGNWASLPAPNGSNNGGDWYTCAQTAGC